MNESIITIQETLARQAAEIAELSEALYAQHKEIAALRREMQRLREEMESGLSGAPDAMAQEKPPHY